MIAKLVSLVPLFLCMLVSTGDNLSLESFSPEVIVAILHQLPPQDQVALTSACHYLQAFPLYAHTLGPIIPKSRRSRVNLYFYSAMTIGSFGIFAGSCISPQFRNIVTMFPIKAIGAFFTLRAVVMASPEICAFLDTTYEKIITYEHQRQKSIKVQPIVSAHTSLADYMSNHTCFTDTLHICHAARSENLHSLFRATQKTNIHTVVIDIDAQYEPEPLKLCSLLTRNSALKNLTLTTHCQELPKTPSISADSFAAGIKCNNQLARITLCAVNLSPHLLDTLFANNALKELALNGCYTDNYYTFEALAKNTTLKKLALLYFANQHTHINDTLVPIFLNFMQHNTQLESLTLSTGFMSAATITQLTTSPHKPKRLVTL